MIMNKKIFYEVKVDLKVLKSVGCDYDLEGEFVEWIKDFPDGYCEVRADVTNLMPNGKNVSVALGRPITMNFDLPKRWLAIVQDQIIEEITYKFTYKDVDGVLKFKNIIVEKLDCELAIAKFEKENPTITWREFEHIEN